MKRIPMLLGALVLIVTAVPARAQNRAQLLVDAAWLQQHIKDPNLVLLHVGDKAEYEREHIPGARYIGMRDVSAPQPPMGADMDHSKQLMLELPDPAALRAKLESFGISDNSRIIVYYGKDWISPTTRVAFTLDWAGLGARTSVLDGGMAAWKEHGGTVTADAPVIKPGKLAALAVRNDVVVDDKYVRANLKNPGVRIIDARTRNFYDGVDEGKRPGHIAGATSLPFIDVANDNGVWKSTAQLKALFAQAGYRPGDRVVVYCHIGQQGTAVVYAARLLGYNAALYDGSYTQWEGLADAPVEKTAPGGTR